MCRGQIAVQVPVGIRPQVHNLADHHIVLLDHGILDGNTCLLDGMVRRILERLRVLVTGLGEALLAPAGHVAVLLVLVHRVIVSAHEPALQGSAIEDDGVLLIVARVAGDGHDGIAARRHLMHVQDAHNLRLHDRPLRRG